MIAMVRVMTMLLMSHDLSGMVFVFFGRDLVNTCTNVFKQFEVEIETSKLIFAQKSCNGGGNS